MLISTGLVAHLKACLDQISKWNPTPFQFPYELSCYKSRHGNHVRCPLGGNGYKFVDNTENYWSHWLWPVGILISCVAATIYQSIFEDKNNGEIFTHLLEAVALSLAAAFAYFQYTTSKNFTSFLNEGFRFEERCLAQDPNFDRNYWRTVKYRTLILTGFHLFRLALPIHSLCVATSVSVFPMSPWRLVPTGILKQFLKIEVTIFAGIMQRAISFVYTFLVIYLAIIRYFLLTAVTIFYAQGSMIFMVLASKKVGAFTITQKLKTLVSMQREIQLLCQIYNDIHKRNVIPLVIILGVISNSFSLYILVSNWTCINLQISVIFGNCVIVAFGIILLAFHLAVKLYIESKNLFRLHMFQNNFRCEENSLLRRKDKILIKKYWRSFTDLKIFFFEANFFEGSTPLVILAFSMNCAVNLILFDK